MYGPASDIITIRPAGIPASAYMKALGLSRVTIAGQTFTPEELDAIQKTPTPYCENQMHALCPSPDDCSCACHRVDGERLATDCIGVDNFPE